MRPDHRVKLADIDRAGADTGRCTKGMDSGAYTDDALTQAVVERKFEIISEALSRMRKAHLELAERIPRKRRIVDFRSLLIHGYVSVMPQRVWDCAESHPQLRGVVQSLLGGLGPPNE